MKNIIDKETKCMNKNVMVQFTNVQVLTPSKEKRRQENYES